MAKRVYLAAPFFNDEEVERVEHIAHILRDTHGLDVFSPKEHQLEGVEYMSEPWRDAVFANDVMNIHKADLVVAIYDGKDEGTMVEIGYALANRIPIVVFHETDTGANLMATEAAVAWLTDRQEIRNYDFNELPKKKYFGPMV
jgi:nucleoside 2-deoxyribosyltransferase